MQKTTQGFTQRQHMITHDFEFFHYKDEPGVEIGYHNHDFYEIFFFISGEVNYLLEGKAYKLLPGDIVIVNNRELHRPLIEKGKPYERIVIWVNPRFIKEQSDEGSDLLNCFSDSSKRKQNIIRPDAELSLLLKALMAKLERAYFNTSYGSIVLRRLYLTELLVHINRYLIYGRDIFIEQDIEYNEKVSNIIDYINNNIDSELSLDQIADKFYISKYHMLREFKRYAGYTLHSYIQKKRLIAAKEMLKQGVRIVDVSSRCGFGDYSNFYRTFKKSFGLSPREYFNL